MFFQYVRINVNPIDLNLSNCDILILDNYLSRNKLVAIAGTCIPHNLIIVHKNNKMCDWEFFLYF